MKKHEKLASGDTQSQDTQTTEVPPEGNGNGSGTGTGTGNEEPGGTGKKRKSSKPNSRYFINMQLWRNARLNSLSEPDIASRVAAFTYTPEKFQEAEALEAQTNTLFNQRELAKARPKALTLEINKGRMETDILANRHMQLLELAHEDDLETIEKLMGRQAFIRNHAAWLDHRKRFYANLQTMPGVMDNLMLFNVTLEEVAEAEQKVLAVEATIAQRQAAQGEVQRLTALKNQAYRSFGKWMEDYFEVVEIALKDEPELKEKLGIKVPFGKS